MSQQHSNSGEDGLGCDRNDLTGLGTQPDTDEVYYARNLKKNYSQFEAFALTFRHILKLRESRAPLRLPKYPNNTQKVESMVKVVTEVT